MGLGTTRNVLFFQPIASVVYAFPRHTQTTFKEGNVHVYKSY